ncbi:MULTISPECIES: IclR family transcriptional regulator [unclassified Streptomyces]|uniref:IclR family transcriptional regulator n=1 Tax=unclassified Streptomyces TaxID=2593676 RepID=UPI000BF41495|nr:IclR family transcriptional regulator C-terminal domain-containing protein [Streptomyces sp. Ru87]PGH50230.1 IclR family transcriptional regulator [Streptomyces sp. Ru87]
MAYKPEPTAPLHSVQHALRVLESVARHSTGVDGDQIGRETGLAPDHLSPMLRMLRREGYVTEVSEDVWTAGDTLRLLGSATRDQAVADKLQQSLAELRDDLGAAVYLSHYLDGEVRITQYADGPRAPRVNEWVDFRASAHASAVGKCLLTQLDHNGRRDHISRHRIARLTSRTITDEKVLLTKLANQPPTVPVLDLQEYAVGTVCAAVPITAGRAVGCLALSLPVDHAHRLRQAAETLNRRAAPLALSLTL